MFASCSLPGLDPENPYVTQRPGQEFLWYEIPEELPQKGAAEDYSERRVCSITEPGPAGDAANKRRRLGSAKKDPKLSKVEAYSCDDFGDETWTAKNRQNWPPALRKEAAAFVTAAKPTANDNNFFRALADPDGQSRRTRLE